MTKHHCEWTLAEPTFPHKIVHNRICIVIKTHSSESQGQEEAVHVITTSSYLHVALL